LVLRVALVAVGRMKAGAEADLVRRYLERADTAGRAAALSVSIVEVAESRATRADDRKNAEAASLLDRVADDSVVAALDERGKTLSSEGFARQVGDWRDRGTREVNFLIGGADGLGDAVKARAQLLLSLGAMTWPHQVVRVLIAEQVYRAVTILTGHPYHRP